MIFHNFDKNIGLENTFHTSWKWQNIDVNHCQGIKASFVEIGSSRYYLPLSSFAPRYTYSNSNFLTDKSMGSLCTLIMFTVHRSLDALRLWTTSKSNVSTKGFQRSLNFCSSLFFNDFGQFDREIENKVDQLYGN